METLNRNFREFLKFLVEKEVKFLVVGGYAVGLHGFPRYTGDLDVFIAMSESNAHKVTEVFDEFGFSDLGISASDFLEEDFVVEIGREPNKIQVLTGIDAIDFEQAYGNRVVADFGDIKIPFIGLDDLMMNKDATGRSKDQIDLIELRKIKEESAVRKIDDNPKRK